MLVGDVADDWPAALLSECVDTAEALRERADAWPDEDSVFSDLQDLIADINDTTALLQIEGNAEQAQDAAALLFQLRVAIEQALDQEEYSDEP